MAYKLRTSALVAIFAIFATISPAFSMPATGTIEVCFTPGDDCTGKIVKEINGAKKEIIVQAYSFTSAPIAKALTAAYKRGVKVEAILDKSQRVERYTSATFLHNAGIPVMIDSRHAIAHNKIIIIDRQTVITGSFNFTRAAQERNAENLLVIHGNNELVRRYLENYIEHRQHSTSY